MQLMQDVQATPRGLVVKTGDSVAVNSRPGECTLFDPRVMTGQLATGERGPGQTREDRVAIYPQYVKLQVQNLPQYIILNDLSSMIA